MQSEQARQFFVGLRSQAALGFGHTLDVGRQDLLFATADALGQHVALRLDKLVGAGPWHAFKLVVERFEGHARGQVVAVGIEQAAQCRRGQVTPQLQASRCHHLADEQQFEQHGTGLERLVLDQGDGGIAHGAGQHQVHAALHHRVFPGQELHIFARQRLGAVVGNGHTFVVAQREAGVEHFFARLEDEGVLGVVFAVDAKGVEQRFHVDRQGELVVLLEDGFYQRLAFTRAARVQLQQAIAAGVQFGFQALAFVTGVGDQAVPGLAVAAFEQRQQAWAELVLQGVAGRAGVEERVERFVVPLEQAFLRAALQVGDMQLDGVLLADTVQTADTLFQQVRVGRQVEHHQVVRKLEVAAFAADLGADQHLGAELFIGKVGGCPVALQNAHALMEHRGRNAGAHAQGVFQVHGGFGVGTDDQHLGALEHFQGVDQPVDPWVETPPALVVGAVTLCLEGDLRVQLGFLAWRQLAVLLGHGHRVRVQLALREALDRRAGVTEQHSAGAVAVEQLTDQPRAGLGIAIADRGQQRFALSPQEALDGGVCLRRQAAFVEQLLHGFGDRAVVIAFGAEGGQVVETVGVEQAQASEVAVLAKLFRGSGKQQYARNHLGQLLDQGVFGADLVLVPDQVVSLIDNHQVPAGGKQRILGLLVLYQPLQGHQCQLGVIERVAGVAFDEAFGVEQRHLQVEAPAHFYQPLVLKVLRHQDQYSAGPARQQLAVNDQASLDGLAQAHFVGQQYPRRAAVGDFAGNVQLVSDWLSAATAQPPQRRLHLLAGVLQCVVAQAEPRQRVDLPGKQAVAGQAELNEVRQLGFRQGARLVLPVEAVVDHQPVDVLDLAYGQLPAFEVGDLVTWREAHASQRRIAQGILARVASGRVEHGQQAAILRQDGTQAELCFAVADPALPRLILLRHTA